MVLPTTNNMEYTDYTLKRDVDEFKDLDWNTLGKIADMLNKEKTKADIYVKDNQDDYIDEIDELKQQIEDNYDNFDHLVDIIRDIKLILLQFKEKQINQDELIEELEERVKIAKQYSYWED